VSRLGELKLELPGTSDDLVSGFLYNPAGQIASTTRSNDSYAWTGHGSGTISAQANGLNQLSNWTSALDHDARGNIVADGTYAYGYSSENLLTQLTNSAPGAIQAWSTYAYDPLMRLAVIDSSNPQLDAALGYDGQEIVLEALSNSRTRRYVHGPGTDEPLVAYLVTPTGTSRSRYSADERGSTLRQTNDAGAPRAGPGRYGIGSIGGYERWRPTAGHPLR
jgi:hypothetical protein